MSRPRATFTRYSRPRTWATAATAYDASLTPEQREAAKKLKQFRESTEDEDPFLLEEVADGEQIAADNRDRAVSLVCADGQSRYFALAPCDLRGAQERARRVSEEIQP